MINYIRYMFWEEMPNDKKRINQFLEDLTKLREATNNFTLKKKRKEEHDSINSCELFAPVQMENQ